jgi:phosphoribosylamine--glycine ligase
MRVLVIGGGAREHAISWKLAQESAVSAVLCTPGNPGIASVATCIPGDLTNPAELADLARREAIGLTVVGPEVPLSLGVVDEFVRRGLLIVGPPKTAAQLESSKAFSKDFMARHRVPTARYRVCDSAADALEVIAHGEFGYPLVIKADGLAAGKGVVIAEDRAAGEAAIHSAMVDQRFGSAGVRVVFEEFLVGEEASYFVLADGDRFVTLSTAQDHKRIFDDDRGPNTGGMGAFAPSPLVTPEVERRVLAEIVRPVLEGMQAEGNPYRGFLYVGLMLTKDGPKVIEFNVRFGDPEAQVVFPMLDEDLLPLLVAAARGELASRPARFRDEPHVCVVLAAGGYPDAGEGGKAISGLEQAAAVPGALVFHAGTSHHDGTLVSGSGRVLTIVGRGRSYQDAIDVAYRAASHVSFEGMQMRRDIGRKALSVVGG